MHSPCFHVAIVGAGLGGLAAAIGIARAGHRVTILEQQADIQEVGAGIQIPPNASYILQKWGLLAEVERVSVRPRDFIVRSYQTGKVLCVQNAFPYTFERYGLPYLHIHRADYHRILLHEAESLGVDIRLDSTVFDINFEAPAVRLLGKPDFHADVVIGADGLRSVCREAMLGHAAPPHLTGDMAYRIIVRGEDLRQHPELAELADRPGMTHWVGPNGHVVCYSLKGGELLNVVLVCPDDLPETVNLANAGLDEMRTFFRNWDPRLRSLLRLVKKTQKWRLRVSEEMGSWSHPSGNFVLLGDACHATLPYLAQGAAQAIEDGAALGTLFKKIKSSSQLRDLFWIYESSRKERTTRVIQSSTALRDIFHMRDGPGQRNRDIKLHQRSPFEPYPIPWIDAKFQAYLFSYDAFSEASKAWDRYMNGENSVPKSKVHAHL
ncbi:putative salicylate 1-monooxygenase [Microsporum canis]|uniref:Salicylate hydroxylase n=1 Tax=Arthroderma otae (strain ATCC MYA-4605 / CBS 113480) TaxID=554155 RepID=C5FFD9_ARTOC|nr:salicylate hydroxylase [Microsporum canis CBS 113480]EEQ28523.1 salicylate hydroxylase [Microsporum canis CBS 113480]